MQLMLKEKEDVLVERALERISRARALGKTNVKLSQAEIDALDRLEQNKRPAAAAPKSAPKSKKAVQTRPKVVERKKSKGSPSASNSPNVKATEIRHRGRSAAGAHEEAFAPYPLLPEHSIPPAGAVMYPPSGYYMPAPVRPSGSSSRPGSRTASSQSLRQQQSQTPPVPPSLQPYYQGRYFSNPEPPYAARPSSNSSRASRPDPSEPDWEPRGHSTPSLVSYPIDQLPYLSQTPKAPRFDPSDPRFASPQARRVVSGPVTMYSSQSPYRQPRDELFLSHNSDPAIMHGVHRRNSTNSEDTDDDQGVRVDVTDTVDGDYQIQTRSGAAAAAAATNTGNKGRDVRTRNGRRGR